MEKVQKGYDLVIESSKVSPDDPAIIDSIAWAQHKIGMIDNALINIKKVLNDEKSILSLYSEEELMESLYHGVVITRTAKNQSLHNRYKLRLSQIDVEKKWISKLNQENKILA